MEDERFIYAIIRHNNTPVCAVSSREQAFKICKDLAGVPVSFSAWYNGETSRVTHDNDVLYRIHCIRMLPD